MSKKDTVWMEQVLPMQMDTNETHYVTMRNELITAEQRQAGKSSSSLGINATKLLRLAIMQCKRDDNTFQPYCISIQDFAKLMKIDDSNIYKEVQDICVSLLGEVVLVNTGDAKNKWKAFQWCSRCEYDGNGMLTIQLHDDMKPYVLGLQRSYTSYEVGEILYMKSVYTLRMYELIKMELHGCRITGNISKDIYLSLDAIRASTGTVQKYEKSNDLLKRVIEPSIREINTKNLSMHITYSPVRENRRIVGYDFHIEGMGSYTDEYLLSSPE